MRKRPKHHWFLLVGSATLATWSIAKFQIIRDQVDVLHEGLSIWGQLAQHATETIGLVAAFAIAVIVLWRKK